MISSKDIPFSYLWVHTHFIPSGKITVLDVGCGNGQFTKNMSFGEKWEITGVEADKASILKAKNTGVFKKLIQGDVVKVLTKINKQGIKYDVVICSQLIEHLNEANGKKLLKLIDKVSMKTAIIGTPRGFMAQPVSHPSNKKRQRHLSGWSETDFKKMGYVVRGVGFIPSWSFNGLARSKNNFVSSLFKMISFLMSPFVYFVPGIGAGLVAIKIYDK